MGLGGRAGPYPAAALGQYPLRPEPEKDRINSPIATHCRSSTRPGGPNWGMYLVASSTTGASSPGDGRRRVGRVQVAGDSCQVQPHRLHRPGRIAGPQRGDQLVVIDLVFLPALP
jgi:hypothetical protein